MTEQQYNQPIQLDAIDRLNNQLEQVQVLHEEALRDLQEHEAKLLDRTAYHARRKLITEEHEEASNTCLLYTSPSPRDGLLSRMPSSA